jgi:hypothetical protein
MYYLSNGNEFYRHSKTMIVMQPKFHVQSYPAHSETPHNMTHTVSDSLEVGLYL